VRAPSTSVFALSILLVCNAGAYELQERLQADHQALRAAEDASGRPRFQRTYEATLPERKNR